MLLKQEAVKIYDTSLHCYLNLEWSSLVLGRRRGISVSGHEVDL